MTSRGNRSTLTWRLALLIAVAIALLGAVTMFITYRSVEQSMYRNLRSSLHEEVQTLAEAYTVGGVSGSPFIGGPNAGVVLQIYGHRGSLIIASQPEFELSEAVLPADVVVAALNQVVHWSGTLAGSEFEAALASFDLGIVALLADTTYIRDVLVTLARNVSIGTGLIVVLSLLTGYFVAAAGLRPLRRLARYAAQLDAHSLQQLPYSERTDEIGALSFALNDLLTRLHDVVENQRLFLAETSHELRTPLTALQGFLSRGMRKTQQSEVASEIRNAQRVTFSMVRLVEDLLQLSRGRIVQAELSNLVDVNQDVMIPVVREFPGITTPDCTDELPVLGDAERLKQLLRNLLTNAVRAAGRPEGVAVLFALRAGRVSLQVRDDGPGIPTELQQRLFEKFITSHTGGSGLGLAIAQQIAEHHGGTIAVASEPGNTVFTVELPLLEIDEDD